MILSIYKNISFILYINMKFDNYDIYFDCVFIGNMTIMVFIMILFLHKIIKYLIMVIINRYLL